MISRSRSAPTAEAMSIEWTRSANKTVTCLYSADRVACVSGAPHLLQKSESGGRCVPQDVHDSPVVVSPSPLGSTSIWCHRRSAVSVISHVVSDMDFFRDYLDRYEKMATDLGFGGHMRGPRRWRDSGGESGVARHSMQAVRARRC
jgi:hypothetical protein